MKNFKWLYLPLLLSVVAVPLWAQNDDVEDMNNRDDIEARAFIRYQQDKIELPEGEEGLTIGGDVRAKWVRQNKETQGYRTRGSGAANPVTIPEADVTTVAGEPLSSKASVDRCNISAHLQADYETKLSWMQLRLEFGDHVGIENTETRSTLEVAWMGYEFYRCGKFEVFGEIGRQPMRNIFTSRIQFNSVFNGILLTYERPLGWWGDFVIHGGPSVVSFPLDQYAWFGEIGLEDIANTGFYTLYSYAHWKHSRAPAQLRYRYINSQLIVGYHLLPEKLGYDSKIQAGFLINHAAQAIPVSANAKRNTAWYLGVQIGQLKKAGDWLLDCSYQVVGYQAVPDFDYCGIGRGNYTSRGDLPAVASPTDPDAFQPGTNLENLDPATAEGNNNFKGFLVRYYYNITSDFTIKAELDYSVAKDEVVGGKNNNRQCELALVYSF